MRRLRRLSIVSIHAPARGATPKARMAVASFSSFNSRAREGRDKSVGCLHCRQLFQFTRPRGARPMSVRSTPMDPSFNSRAREGRDIGHRASHIYRCLFQFTRPRGARRPFPMVIPFTMCFNSRAREGRDLPFRAYNMVYNVSIHAPARGATSSNLPLWLPVMVSIHAPARGATSSCIAFVQTLDLFQFTRPRGARP